MKNILLLIEKDNDASSVWYYCLISKDRKCTKCKRYSAVLKTLGRSTKGLHKHLSTKYGTKVQKEFNMTALPSTNQNCVEDKFLFKKRKLMIFLALIKNHWI